MHPLVKLPKGQLSRIREEACHVKSFPSSSSSSSSSSSCSSFSLERHRRELKQLSDARIAGWDDTVEAKRDQKLRAKAERRRAEELERERMDAEEARLELLERRDTLARAKALVYEQTDAFKTFRSAQQHADTLHTLKTQLQEKQAYIDRIKAEEEAHHRQILAQLAEAEATERKREQRQRDSVQAVARVREEMMAQAAHRKALGAAAKKEEGVALLIQAQHEKDEDKAKVLAQKQRCKDDTMAMIQANLWLREYRLQLAQDEAREDAKIVAEVQSKEAMAAARAAAIKERFDAKQAIRQRLIDRACEELARQTNDENDRLERYEQEQQDKEMAAAAWRAQMKQRQRETILEDMQLHKQRKEESKRAPQAETRRQLEVWAQENEAQVRRDWDTRARRRQQEQEVRQHLDRQLQELQAAKQKDHHGGASASSSVPPLPGEQHFQAYAKQQIEVAREQGKPLYPLLRAVQVKEPYLLPATTNPARRRRRNGEGGNPAGATRGGQHTITKVVQGADKTHKKEAGKAFKKSPIESLGIGGGA